MRAVPTFRRGLLYILLAASSWGTTGLTSRVLRDLSGVDAISTGFLRVLIASPALLLMAQVLAPGSLRPALRANWRAMLLLGLSMAAYNACFFLGVSRSSVAAATLLAICSSPLFVAGLARIFLHEPQSRAVLAALAAGLVGAGLLLGGQGPQAVLRPDFLPGNLFALGAGFSYACYALIGRAISRAHSAPPAAAAAISFSLAAAMMAPLALANGLRLPTTLPAWLAALWLGLVPTALAYLLVFMGLRVVTATTTGIATLMEPLTATVLAVLVLKERLTPLSSLGALLLFSSLAILTLGGRPRRAASPTASG